MTENVTSEDARKELMSLLDNEDDVDAFINVINSVNDDNSLEGVHDDDDKEINATEESVGMEVAMDSGATANVAHPKHMPGDVVIVPNETGFHFKGANNSNIIKFGECDTILADENGGQIGCHWNAPTCHDPCTPPRL